MSNPPSHPRLVVGGAHLWEGEGRMTRRGEIFSLSGIKIINRDTLGLKASV